MDKILIRLYGRVQGIGYRWFISEAAKRHSLSGWVKNMDDGTVECGVSGVMEEINKFIEEIKTGHPIAKIENVDIRNCYDLDFPDDFMVRQ